MDQRKRKEEFCKKVDKMIKGKGKRPRKNSNNINANSVIIKSSSGSTSNNNANGVISANSTSNSDGDTYIDNDIDGTTDNNKVVNSYQKIEGIRNLEIKC